MLMINFLIKYCPMRSGYHATHATLKKALFAKVIKDMLVEVSTNQSDVNHVSFSSRTKVNPQQQ